MRWLVLILALSGCVGKGTGHSMSDQLAEATQVVWHDLYGETGDPPAVVWRGDTSCHWVVNDYLPSGYYIGFRVPGQSGCYAGWYTSGTAQVALPGYQSDYPISQTGYAHELFHAHLERSTGDLDPDHRNPDWATEVPVANELLQGAGL